MPNLASHAANCRGCSVYRDIKQKMRPQQPITRQEASQQPITRKECKADTPHKFELYKLLIDIFIDILQNSETHPTQKKTIFRCKDIHSMTPGTQKTRLTVELVF